ncbi:MAG: pirin family protein [Gammaproteobacteria bacterium]|nr:pirin family protein [Gammaproteobacteria bacterium]
MNIKPVDRIIKTIKVTEGAGVTVYRSIGTPALRNFDPFIMLDYFGSDVPDDYIAGFPDHPHRGFNTFTYMLDGNMLHQDSMGNRGNLTAGGAQWMKAGSGVIHSEMPKQAEGLMHGFQLWINLPAQAKMTEPSYQEFSADAFSIIETDGQRVKVLLGEYQNSRGPIIDPYTHVHYLDVHLDAGVHFEHNLSSELSSFIYLFEGSAQIADTHIDQHNFVTLGDGEHISLTASQEGARFILVAGRPIGEPIVQHGPFVMNTQAEIHRAIEDYQNGKLVQQKPAMVTA